MVEDAVNEKHDASSSQLDVSTGYNSDLNEPKTAPEPDVQRKSLLDEQSPIVYQYLTFETPLPFPTPSTNNENAPPPPEPNLKPYISPFLWPKPKKDLITWLCVIATSLSAYTAGGYSPAERSMASEWHVSTVAVTVGITTFTSGFAIAPMVLAPFSEINGRYPVFVIAGIVFVIFQIGCAVSESYPAMLVCRFFTGVGASVFSTMVGGVISDMFHAKERNTPMALFSGGALFGTGLGPLVSGFVVEYTHWRWVFRIQIIMDFVLVALLAICLKETRGSVLLSNKASALNKWYEEREAAGYYGLDMTAPTRAGSQASRLQPQRIRWKVKSDEERESLSKAIGISVYRPFHLLFTEPVVFFFSLWVAFAWAVLYLTFGSIPIVFERTYHFNLAQSGAVFASLSTGAVLITALAIQQEKALAFFLKSPSKPSLLAKLDLASPEARLYFACIESILLPIGLFWFGWGTTSSSPWPSIISIACATMGIYSIYLATFNYLADTYHRYASSALAAQSFCRNMLGGVFPLVTPALFNNLGFPQAASLLGALAAGLTVVPWVLVVYGPAIRKRSNFASEIM